MQVSKRQRLHLFVIQLLRGTADIFCIFMLSDTYLTTFLSHIKKQVICLKKWSTRFSDKVLQQSLVAKLDTTWFSHFWQSPGAARALLFSFILRVRVQTSLLYMIQHVPSACNKQHRVAVNAISMCPPLCWNSHLAANGFQSHLHTTSL